MLFTQNIIYYECCEYEIHGENFIETDITDGYDWWCQGRGYIEDQSFTCPNCGK